MPDSYAIRPILDSLLARRDLTRAQAAELMSAIVEGNLPPASIAAFAIALRMKGETAEELAGLAESMRAHAIRIEAPANALDTCGTGGDGCGTFNISTATALVVAGMGIPVAKHGGRAASSPCGSADVLKALGVNIDLPPAGVERCLREAGIGFLFAPVFHPGMKHVAPVRKELGVRTVFNLLGPLSNPANARRQLLGVSVPQQCELFARVLQQLGSERAMIVCGAAPDVVSPLPPGESRVRAYMDEISTFGPTTISRLQDGEIKTVSLDARKFGIPEGNLKSMQINTAEESAAMIRALLEGRHGSARDIVALNAAAAAQIAGLAPTWVDGLKLAHEAIDSGKAKGALEKLMRVSNA